jgi:hypothetical protein
MNFPVKDFAVSYSPASISVQPPPSPTESVESSSSVSSSNSDALSVAAVRGRAVALARMRTLRHQERARKSVRFAMDVKVDYTHSADDYDRSSLPVAKLNFCNFAELLEIRASIRRQAEMTLLEATQGRVAKGNLPAMQARGIIRC